MSNIKNYVTRLNEGVSGVEKPKTWLELPFTKNTKAIRTRNITRRFKQAKYRNEEGGLKEYSKAYNLVKLAIGSELLRNPELKFGNKPFSEIMTLLIVKAWQQGKTLHPYEELSLSATSKCTNNWIKQILSIFLENKNKYEQTENDEQYYNLLEDYITTNYKNASNFRKVFDEIPMDSVVRLTYATYENIASILAFGLIDTNNSWFNYDSNGKAIDIKGNHAERMRELGCTVKNLNNFYAPRKSSRKSNRTRKL